MANKTIRLDDNQESQLAKCMELLNTKSAQATFEVMLVKVPQLLQDRDSLTQSISNFKSENRDARDVIQGIYNANMRLEQFIEKSK